MKSNIDFTDDDLRLVLRRMDERDTLPLPSDFSVRVMSRDGIATCDGRFRGSLQKLIWAAAACLVVAIVLTTALWRKPETTIYEDTFASVEEASLVLCNNMDNNTIAL